jgi:S1-C subfamily serine protease
LNFLRSIARCGRRLLHVTVVTATLLAGGAVIHHNSVRSRETNEMLTRLSAEVSRLSQEQSMPAVVVARHRSSICYIYALYSLTPPTGHRGWQRPVRTRVSGSGFVVANGVIATNRHVVQPWYDDEEDEAQIALGYTPKLEKLVAFFPDRVKEIPLTDVAVSHTHDLAIVRFATSADTASLRPLPLAPGPAVPGDAVVVVGYPMGVTAMLAKSPHKVYKRLAYAHETFDIANDLAQHYLIRPSATYGHLGDVVEDKLIYDAPTAQGGSGGPVFNSRGQVIGVNSAYIDGFAGGTLGVSVEALKPLLARQMRRNSSSVATTPSDSATAPVYIDADGDDD